MKQRLFFSLTLILMLNITLIYPAQAAQRSKSVEQEAQVHIFGSLLAEGETPPEYYVFFWELALQRKAQQKKVHADFVPDPAASALANQTTLQEKLLAASPVQLTDAQRKTFMALPRIPKLYFKKCFGILG